MSAWEAVVRVARELEALGEDRGEAEGVARRVRVRIVGFAGIGLGVFWYAWGKVGFWWAVVYGIFWIPWLGYRIAGLLKLGE